MKLAMLGIKIAGWALADVNSLERASAVGPEKSNRYI